MTKNVKNLKDDIGQLRIQLNTINDEKESLYSQKSDVSKKITELINKVKQSKIDRDTKTRNVSSLKAQRKQLNEEIKKKIEAIKEINRKKADTIKKHNIQIDPQKVKREIESLEFKIETVPMGFDKEQKLMKRLHTLKNQFKKIGELSEVFSESSKLSKDIDKQKKLADKIHREIQALAQGSQKNHEEMITVSNEIDELKKQEKELFDTFTLKKNEFNEINNKLKSVLGDLSKETEIVKIDKKKKAEKKKADVKKSIKEKSKEVDEKIKKKQKLTTEDLLLYQANNFEEKGN